MVITHCFSVMLALCTKHTNASMQQALFHLANVISEIISSTENFAHDGETLKLKRTRALNAITLKKKSIKKHSFMRMLFNTYLYRQLQDKGFFQGLFKLRVMMHRFPK